MSSAICCNLDQLKILLSGNGLKDNDNDTHHKLHLIFSLYLFPKRQIFQLVQIESICRLQNKCDPRIEIRSGWAENTVGKGENTDYQHFVLLPQCFLPI